MNGFLNLLMSLSAALSALAVSERLIHYFQLESYQFPGYYKSVRRNVVRAALPGALLFAVQLICFGILALTGRAPVLLRLVLCLLLGGAVLTAGWRLRKLFHDKKAKKPLVYTPRIKRLVGIAGILFLMIGLLLCGIAPVLLAFLPLLLPVWVAAAGLFAWPVEKLISELYFRDAQKRLRARPDLIKIGITGSYGKTSVKFILGTMLQEKYQTLVTPSSYNTPMGVTKVIRTALQPGHQVFVAEMGARHVGDIKELCRLVHPTLGIITSVGPQHLDTFKTLERIKGTKYELIDALPENGIAFFPDDAGICREFYEKTGKEKHLASLNRTKDAEVWAEDIRVSSLGSDFLLCTEGGSIACHTRLLGQHNIQNILLCASVCLKLGMTLKQISRGIARLEPVEHRLQLLPGRDVIIIDDAFNSNPRGVEAALDVLSSFPQRRIIVTPGMVELGEEEAAFNREFGRKVAHAADIAILVGKKHAAPIREGLLEEGFPEENIYLTASLEEASGILWKVAGKGDTALFENDLPDNYTE